MSESPNSSLGIGGSQPTQWFGNPFFDQGSLYAPNNISSMLTMCEMLWSGNGTYRMAMERVCSYFLTEVEILDVPDGVKKKYKEFLNDSLDITSLLRSVALDFLFYGNSFSSPYIPFRRYLSCKSCRFEQPIDKVIYTFKQLKYYGKCQKCKATGELESIDRSTMEHDKFKIVRWNPHNIQLMFHPISHTAEYLLRPTGDMRRHVQLGTPFYIQNMPDELIRAAYDNTLFAFFDDMIHHMREDTLAGFENRGWGIPRAMSNFRQAFYVQVLKRYNEALALDYIVPWRVITPGGPRGADKIDPLLQANLGDFGNFVETMIREHRIDPLSVHVLPFPIEYQALSGEGRELAPSDLLTLGLDELLNSCGVPADLYKGSLQLQALPAALRLFESTWPHLIAALNKFLNWLMGILAASLNWEPARARLTPISRADDMEARVVRLQLAAAQKISDTTALSPFGIDVREEIRRMFDEQRMLRDETTKMQREQQQQQEMDKRLAETNQVMQGGMMPPGGAPVAPGGGAGGGMGAPGSAQGGGVTPADVLGQADQIAQQLSVIPEGERRRQLSAIKQQDETLHAVVKQKLSNLRTQARSIGQEQVLQQMAGGQ